MFCKNCGTEFNKENDFCINCGNSRSSKSNVAKSKNILREVFFKFRKNIKKWLIIGFVLVVLILIVVLVFWFNNKKSNSNTTNNSQSVVDIICDNGEGGSGTIFTSDGMIITNNHVVSGSTNCQITIPDTATGKISKIYNGVPVIVPKLSKEYDIAGVQINGSFTDKNGRTWGVYPTTFLPFVLPSTCDSKIPSKLGDSVRIYGYPVTSGGYNLTVTDGVISSFSDDGDILTSAQVDSGNSGGLAIDQYGCWLGIPSAVVSGNYQNLGVIIPGSVVRDFFNNIPDESSNSSTDSYTTNTPVQPTITAGETDDEICHDSYGTYSEWSGKKGSDGNPLCKCQTGYSWDTTGDACVTKTSLDQLCENNYGSESYSYVQGGKAVCGCSVGYQFNNDKTSCVLSGCTNGEQFSITTGLSCSGDGSCVSGSFLDKNTGKCVSPLTYCQNQNGPLATYNSVDNSCGCATGYGLGSNNMCESHYQTCGEKYPNTTWDGTYSSDGKYNCVCQTGYTWNSYSQSCY